jgi:hypothetical protein
MSLVMAGLDPAISIPWALCPPKRDRRVKPGDDESIRRIRLYAERARAPSIMSTVFCNP